MRKPLVRKNQRRFSWVCVGLGWALAFLVLLGSGGTEQASTIHCDFKGLPDGTVVLSGVSLWPPGTRCRYTLPNGSEVNRTAAWGIGAWVLVTAAGAAAGFVPRALRLWREPHGQVD